MEKFYKNGKEVPSTEGIVEKAEGSAPHIGFLKDGQYTLELKIDTFKAPVIVPTAHNLRIDVGERVRLYSSVGFDSPRNGCGGLIAIDALEILGEGNRVLFRYISSRADTNAVFEEHA